MTTAVIVKANHGWPVDVTQVNPTSGAPLNGYSTQRVEADAERIFYVHSGVDLRIHEVQPGEIEQEPGG